MVSTAMLSLKKSTNTSKTNNLPNNLSEIASNFFDYANCTGLLQNQVIFAAAPFFFKEGNPGSAEHYIFRLKRSRLMQKV